jgi:nucleoside 2-deoxyribosyltransferase
MTIYLGCGLTHVPRDVFSDYVSLVHRIAAELEGAGTKVIYALKHSDPQLAEKPFDERARLCYLWDRELVEKADILVAEASYSSTGLGIEMQIAESHGKPIIICFRTSADTQAAAIQYENPDHTRHTLQIGDGYVSLMALGIPSVFKVIRYERADDLMPQLVRAVLELKRNNC